ncbi:MAG TPA: hypothetical protein PLG94_12420 [Smithellaceae bacterium]|nr:hypothetical protein [Smithellaceae bacterium]
MPTRIRVLDSTSKSMQRLGYLKALCALVNETETSNLVSLGRRLIEKATKRVKIKAPFEEGIQNYVKERLKDGTYKEIRQVVAKNTPDTHIALEIQDMYLADPTLPSSAGKLVGEDWRRYPYLGTALELVKKGTYSALTRSIVLLNVTPKEELDAFIVFDKNNNPLRIRDAQALVLLYCLIDNDAEVLQPFFMKLTQESQSIFNERFASAFLPQIFYQLVKNYQDKNITAEERKRLGLLKKTAAKIEEWKGKLYTGGGAPQETVRVRLEPFCDLGLLRKPKADRYEYQTTPSLHLMMERWVNIQNTEKFLQEQYFDTFAAIRGIKARPAEETEALDALVQAGEALKSSLGYTPITDVGLLAGTRLLTEKGLVLELGRTTELLKQWQKRDPNFIRFTVDRMGTMAHVKFLKSHPEKSA